MKSPHVTVWFVLVSAAAAYGNIVYLSRQINDSVEFPCVFSDVRGKVFAFNIKRTCLNPMEVLYVHMQSDDGRRPDAYQGRIFEKRDLGKQRVSVSITHLQPDDTDVYQCVFFHDEPPSGYSGIPGATEFFLHVSHENPCSCYDNMPLVYSLLAAAGLLLLSVLGLTTVFCPQKKMTNQPIYEDMRIKLPVRS